jgi:hypothetical protein
MTEAERLAAELQRYGVTTMNRWAIDGALMIRKLAAENEALRMHWETRANFDALQAENEALKATSRVAQMAVVDKCAEIYMLKQDNESLQDLLSDALANLNEMTDAKNAENESLRVDAERMDWLENNAVITYGYEATVKVAFPLAELGRTVVTLRQTVDEAMKGEQT